MRGRHPRRLTVRSNRRGRTSGAQQLLRRSSDELEQPDRLVQLGLKMLERIPNPAQVVRLQQLPVLIGVAAGILAFWFVGEVLLVAFGGLLVAVLLNSLASWAGKLLHLSYRWSLSVVVAVLLALFCATAFFVGARVAEQTNQLFTIVPVSIQQIRNLAAQHSWGQWLQGASSPLVGAVTRVASQGLRLLVDIVIMAFVGVYFASEPDVYRAGLIHLFPLGMRPQAQSALREVSRNVRWWLFGQIFSMIVIAVLIGLAMWWINMPLALALGLLAGAFEIVPTVGPIVWLVPAMLVALPEGTNELVRVFLVYCGLHLVESYVLVPIVQRRAVRLLPSISILSILFFTLTQGVLGTMMAAPSAVVAIALIKVLYVEDTLGDHGVMPAVNESGNRH